MSPVIQLLVSFHRHGFKTSFTLCCRRGWDTNNMKTLLWMSLQFTWRDRPSIEDTTGG